MEEYVPVGSLGLATLCLVILSTVKVHRGMSVEDPAFHAVWSAIMLLAGVTAIVTDLLHVDGVLWHALDAGTATFCITLSIASMGRYFRLRARQKSSVTTEVVETPPDLRLVTWTVVNHNTGQQIDKVKIPDYRGYPQNVYPIRHDLYKNNTFMATRQGGPFRGRTG